MEKYIFLRNIIYIKSFVTKFYTAKICKVLMKRVAYRDSVYLKNRSPSLHDLNAESMNYSLVAQGS